MTLTMARPLANPIDDHDLYAIHAVHRAVRHQSRSLLGAIRRLDPADEAAVAQVRQWFAQADAVIRLHHHVVSWVLVPAVTQADPQTATYVGSVVAGNDQVACELDRVTAALAGLAKAGRSGDVGWSVRHGEAVAAATSLVRASDHQIDRERATLLTTMVEVLPRIRFDELRAALVVRADPKLLPFLFPWLVASATPAQEAQLITQLPRMLALAHRMVWAPNYARTYPLLEAAGRYPTAA